MDEKIRLLGESCLRMKSAEVDINADPLFMNENVRLKTALDQFRNENSFGRGIAAPQIGINKRFISINTGSGTFTMINPVIIRRSNDMFTMWDDCMSFPDILVKVKRHLSVSVSYLDEKGARCLLENLQTAESELLQHEIDHLDGILAIDHSIGTDGIIYRKVFERSRDFFTSQVDYVI